jgi:hypothetical protein
MKVKLSQGKVEWFNQKEFNKNTYLQMASSRRIATQRITGVDERLRIVATIIEPKSYFADSTNSISLSENSKYSLEYILAIMNSSLMQWRFKVTSTNNNVGTNELSSLPFRAIDFLNIEERNIFQTIHNLVKQLEDSYRTLIGMDLNSTHEYLTRKVEMLHENIDEHVFELYGITKHEKEIIVRKVSKERGKTKMSFSI